MFQNLLILTIDFILIISTKVILKITINLLGNFFSLEDLKLDQSFFEVQKSD